LKWVSAKLKGTAVSLKRTPFSAKEQSDGIGFLMASSHSLVNVLVTRQALQQVGGNTFYFGHFEEFRAHFEFSASEKFASGRVEADGSIRIEASDVPQPYRTLCRR